MVAVLGFSAFLSRNLRLCFSVGTFDQKEAEAEKYK